MNAFVTPAPIPRAAPVTIIVLGLTCIVISASLCGAPAVPTPRSDRFIGLMEINEVVITPLGPASRRTIDLDWKDSHGSGRRWQPHRKRAHEGGILCE